MNLFTLAALLLLFVPNVVLAQDIDQDADSGNPIRLTDYGNGTKHLKMQQRQLTYTVWDQCERRSDQDRVKSYGLHFLLPRGYLCPDEGITICYPGQLDKNFNRTGIGAAIQFRVKNKKNNNITKFCEEKRAEFCNASNYKCGKEDEDGKIVDVDGMPAWHGLRLYTNNTNGTTIGQRQPEFLLELSISNKIYKIGVYDELFIELGNRHSPNTTIRANGKRIRFKGDGELRDAYHQRMGSGAFLYKYAGLWMLALDVLPTEAEDQLELYTYRGCRCALEAYFTHPWDEVGPELPQHLHTSMPKTKCKVPTEKKEYKYKQSVHLNLGRNNERETKKVLVWLMTHQMTNKVKIELLDEETNKLIIGMKMQKEGNISGDAYGSISFTKAVEGKWYYDSSERIHRFLKDDIEIRVELTIYPNFILVSYNQANGVQVLNSFWRERWWNNTLLKHLPNKVIVQTGARVDLGQVLLEDAETKKFDASYPIVGDIEDEIQITIRGRVHENADNFSINLMHDAPEWHIFIGATVLRMEVKLLDNGENKINWKSYMNQTWSDEKTTTVESFFPPGQPFECVFVVQRMEQPGTDETIAKYSVSVNGKHLGKGTVDLPIWTINWIWLDGEVDFLDEPFVYFPELQRNVTVWKHSLSHLLYYGDVLCIEGLVHELNEKTFSISLMHESSEFSTKIGDTPMRATFTLSDIITRSTIVFEKYRFDLREWLPCLECTGRQRINPPTLFRAKITVLDYGYEMVVGDEILPSKFNYSMKLDNGNDTVYTPPWATNWVMVTGSITNVTFGEQCKGCECGQKPLPMHIDHLYQILHPGSVVTIGGIVKEKEGTDQWIRIYFFREALEWHKIIGSTVLNINLTNLPGDAGINATFNTHYNNKWKANETIHPFSHAIFQPKLVAGDEFKLRVEVTKETFNIHYGDNPVVRYKQFMPYWAVQYIVVQGDLVPMWTVPGLDGDKQGTKTFVDIIFR